MPDTPKPVGLRETPGEDSRQWKRSECRKGVPVQGDRPRFLARPIGGTGPWPVLCELTEAPDDGVIVDVVQGGPEGLPGNHVSVIAAAVKPEAVGLVLLPCGEQSETIGIVEAQVPNCPAGHGLLQRSEEGRNGVFGLRRPDEEMHVLGHDHVGPDVESVFLSGERNGPGQIVTRPVSSEERTPFRAREGQLMSVERDIVAFAGFPMWRAHAAMYRDCHHAEQAMREQSSFGPVLSAGSSEAVRRCSLRSCSSEGGAREGETPPSALEDKRCLRVAPIYSVGLSWVARRWSRSTSITGFLEQRRVIQ